MIKILSCETYLLHFFGIKISEVYWIDDFLLSHTWIKNTIEKSCGFTYCSWADYRKLPKFRKLRGRVGRYVLLERFWVQIYTRINMTYWYDANYLPIKLLKFNCTSVKHSIVNDFTFNYKLIQYFLIIKQMNLQLSTDCRFNCQTIEHAIVNPLNFYRTSVEHSIVKQFHIQL